MLDSDPWAESSSRGLEMKWFKAVCLLTLLITTRVAHCETLAKGDYVGSWVSMHPISRGEITSLRIASDFTTTYTRHFDDAPEQSFHSSAEEFAVSDDLVVIKFRGKPDGITYKLVLGGWKQSSGRKIFGMMYMYRDDALFNGIPVTFQPK